MLEDEREAPYRAARRSAATSVSTLFPWSSRDPLGSSLSRASADAAWRALQTVQVPCQWQVHVLVSYSMSVSYTIRVRMARSLADTWAFPGSPDDLLFSR